MVLRTGMVFKTIRFVFLGKILCHKNLLCPFAPYAALHEKQRLCSSAPSSLCRASFSTANMHGHTSMLNVVHDERLFSRPWFLIFFARYSHPEGFYSLTILQGYKYSFTIFSSKNQVTALLPFQWNFAD